ncbi:MAG TPA: hypothetical protein VFZ53_22520 [Polyangiaceae bacterium]
MRALLTFAVVASLLARPAAAYQTAGSERVDRTAYTLRGGELSLGVRTAELGIVDELLIGTYVPTWFAGPVLGEPIPTGFVKLRAPFDGSLAIAGRAAAVYVDADVLASNWLENDGSTASVWILPLSLAASYRFGPSFSQSAELTYVAVAAAGDHEGEADIHGALTSTNVTLSTLSELRLSRVFALTLLAKLMVYRGDARVTTEFETETTHVDAELGADKPYSGVVAAVVPGFSLSFSHVNFELGAGYGHLWLPAVELPVRTRGLVPEANFYVRF